jgi:hypothetical protein
MSDQEFRPLTDRLAGYRPRPGADFYQRMERAPWNGGPARWPDRALLRSGLSVVWLLLLLVALVALVDWIRERRSPVSSGATYATYASAYDRRLAMTLAPYLAQFSPNFAEQAAAVPALPPCWHSASRPDVRPVDPPHSLWRSAPALCLAGW